MVSVKCIVLVNICSVILLGFQTQKQLHVSVAQIQQNKGQMFVMGYSDSIYILI